eukprot:Opistho-1_new@74989
MKKLVVAAGTGFLGQVLINHFKDDFDKITILTRGKSEVKKGIKFVNWDAKSLCGWEAELEKDLAGIVNLISPKPIRNAVFMKKLRAEMKIPFGIPTPKPLLQLGAKIISTEAELVLKSRNVIPKRLQESGFKFEFGTIEQAFKNLLNH